MYTYQVIYQRHAVERMAQRGISEEDVMHALLTGETIQIYPDDTPFPSELMLGWREKTTPCGSCNRCHAAKEDRDNRL